MGHSRQQYEDRLRARLGDLGLIQHIEETQIPLAIEDALATFSKDKPRIISDTLSGDGSTQTFDLTTLLTGWNTGWSSVLSIEYPVGQIPRSLIDSHNWDVDEETDLLTVYGIPADGTDNIKVRFTATYPFPVDDPNTDVVQDVYFPAVCAKAAAVALRAKANEYARAQSTSVAGDLFRRDPAPLFEGARNLDKVYNDTVLGRPTGEGTAAQVGLAVSDVDVFPASLFHRREDYVSEESLGG